MELLVLFYKNYIVILQEWICDVLVCFKLDVLFIYFGELFNVFFDDYFYLFKVNL